MAQPDLRCPMVYAPRPTLLHQVVPAARAASLLPPQVLSAVALEHVRCVVSWKPMVRTQTLTLASRPVHWGPTPVFQLMMRWARTPALAPMVAQFWPEATLAKRSQFFTMPGWVGWGVEMPFPAVVVDVGATYPTVPTQACASFHSSVHDVPPTEFHRGIMLTGI